MPDSVISKMSHSPLASVAVSFAKDIASREIRLRMQSGAFKDNPDPETIKKVYNQIYREEYYRYYSRLVQTEQQNRNVTYYLEHPATRRYTKRHTAVNFTKLNCFIHVHRGCITVGKINYPVDEDDSIETEEAFLSSWPGPLDQPIEDVRRRVTDYLDTLLQHASQKRLHYTNPTSDEHRKTILNLLAELLHRNGTIDAPGITKLLLQPEQTEIQKDESNKKPLETLQKYLLLGKRSEAIKYAKSKRYWDHAQCLAFLDKYQPPYTKNYFRETMRLRDDPVVLLNDEYINCLDQSSIIHVVYRSLLNRILQSDPGSLSLVKRPNVDNNNYEFAILSANDCDMDFDQSNQVFRLVTAVKNINSNPSIAKNHLILLGFTSLESNEYCDDVSFRSLVTYEPPKIETHLMRTLTISNIDMIILNEIWEYCQNLAWNTCSPESYQYMVNLIPYKLIFASRLLDYGELNMFTQYVNSIRYALDKAGDMDRDPFYDWETIDEAVNHLYGICENFRQNPAMSPFLSRFSPDLTPPNVPTLADVCPPPTGYDGAPQIGNLYSVSRNDTSAMDFTDTSRGNYSYAASEMSNQFNYAQLNRNIPQQPMQNLPLNQQPITEEITDFNPEPEPSYYDEQGKLQDDLRNDYSEETSRRTSIDTPAQPLRQQNYPYPVEPDHNAKTMTSSSPVQKTFEPRPSQPPMSDSFSVMSPINETQPPGYIKSSASYNSSLVNETKPQGLGHSSSSNINSSSSNNISSNQRTSGARNLTSDGPKSTNNQPATEHRSGLLTNVLGSVGALLPRSNSKQMILPDDSKKNIEYDEERGAWIDKSNPDAESAITNEPPPMMPVQNPPSYSFANRSTKARYPKSQIGP